MQLDNEDTEKISLVSEKSETKSDAYFEIGPIDCYALDYIEEYETTGFGNTDGMLYAKTYNGKDYFFVTVKELNDNKKYPVIREDSELWGMVFNGRFESDSCSFFVNISAWEPARYSSERDYEEHNKDEVDKQNATPQKVVVEHQNVPQPVQEWIPCPVCGNTGRVGLCQHCNGTGQDLYYMRDYRDCPMCGGLKKCTTCGGTGGHYETRYR